MKPLLRAVTILGGLGLSVSLTGCGGLSDYEQGRLDNLNSAVNEFNAESIAEIVCKVEGGEVALHTGFTRLIVLADTDSWQSIAERLQSLGYSGVTQAPTLTMARDDGLFVAARMMSEPGSEPEIEEHLLNNGCTIPAEGAVAIQFEERLGN